MTPIPIIIINIAGAVLLTSLTGGIIMLLYLVVGKILECLGFINICYDLLRLSTFFFLCPIAYIFLKCFAMKIGDSLLFSPTPIIWPICKNAFIIWCIGVVLFLGNMVSDLLFQHKICQVAVACDERVMNAFYTTKERLGINSENLRVKKFRGTYVPYIVGILRPTIILPDKEYTEEQLQVVFTHEMTHYLQKDLWLKYISVVIRALHFFNPLAWVLYSQTKKQSEYMCDYNSYEKVGGLKHYFAVITDMAIEANKEYFMSVKLFERKNELIGRVKKMSKLYRIKRRSTLSVAIVLGIAMATSSMSVYAATMGSAEKYVEWYNATSDEAPLATQGVAEEAELFEYVEEEGVITIVVDADQLMRTVANIDWSINNNVRMCTGYFSCTAGESVSVMVKISPSDANVKVGIENSIGSGVYVTGSGTIMQEFEISATDSYRIFITNQSGGTVTAEGSYIIP